MSETMQEKMHLMPDEELHAMTITSSEACELFGISFSELNRLVREGVFNGCYEKLGIGRQFSFMKTVQARCRYQANIIKKFGLQEDNLQQQKLRHLKIKNDILAQKLEMLKSTLHRAEDLRIFVDGMIIAAREIMQRTIQQTMEQLHDDIQPGEHDKVRKIITELVEDALSELQPYDVEEINRQNKEVLLKQPIEDDGDEDL